jgi:polyhydroxyalkanoate synthesis regulator phasin
MNKLVEFLIPALIGILLIVTLGATLEYYRLIRRAKAEYEKAREVVEDVVLSFNRELKRETEKLNVLGYKIEGTTSKTEAFIKKTEVVEKKITPIEEQLNKISNESLGELAKLPGINVKMSAIEENSSRLETQIMNLENKLKKLTELPEVNIESVVPIRRDKALAALTDTEVAVLEFLSTQGSKTAPEIKEKVNLSREHTARLMKKLYDNGYLERDTGKIPFKYSIKREMDNILNKHENTQV